MTTRFTATIDVGNAEMLTYGQIRDALVKVTSTNEHDDIVQITVGDGGPIKDSNGNRVGMWGVADEQVSLVVQNPGHGLAVIVFPSQAEARVWARDNPKVHVVGHAPVIDTKAGQDLAEPFKRGSVVHVVIDGQHVRATYDGNDSYCLTAQWPTEKTGSSQWSHYHGAERFDSIEGLKS